MRNNYTNLLPSERRKQVRREYFLRIGVVAIAMAISLVGVAMILLIPTYTFLSNSAYTKKARVAEIQSVISSSDEKTLEARLALLSTNTQALVLLENTPSAIGIVRNILHISRSGVTLSRFSYSPAIGGKAGTITLSGIATTRDVLRQYQLALSRASFIASANLPISAYAKDADISFTINITLAS